VTAREFVHLFVHLPHIHRNTHTDIHGLSLSLITGSYPSGICLGSKHSTTELRPHCLFDDKSPRFPCQRHWGRSLRFGGHQPLLLKCRAGQPPAYKRKSPSSPKGERSMYAIIDFALPGPLWVTPRPRGVHTTAGGTCFWAQCKLGTRSRQSNPAVGYS